MLEIGMEAPNFTLPDYSGKMRKLSEFRGQKVILYFFHKVTSAGCKNQTCTFGDLYPQFLEKGATVIGISKGSVETQKEFQKEYNLPFILLSDEELEVIKLYDVLKEKKLFGRPAMGLERTTYLIDEDGIIINVFEKVKPSTNTSQMLDELDE